MYDESDFFAVARFLKLGIKVVFKNPAGERPSFQTSFPTPAGATVKLDESSLFEMERKLRALLSSDVAVKQNITPFLYLGTNFRGILYCNKGTHEYIVEETHDQFGMECKKLVRRAAGFIQLLS